MIRRSKQQVHSRQSQYFLNPQTPPCSPQECKSRNDRNLLARRRHTKRVLENFADIETHKDFEPILSTRDTFCRRDVLSTLSVSPITTFDQSVEGRMPRTAQRATDACKNGRTEKVFRSSTMLHCFVNKVSRPDQIVGKMRRRKKNYVQMRTFYQRDPYSEARQPNRQVSFRADKMRDYSERKKRINDKPVSEVHNRQSVMSLISKLHSFCKGQLLNTIEAQNARSRKYECNEPQRAIEACKNRRAKKELYVLNAHGYD